MAGQLVAIPDARRSKQTGNDYGFAQANLGEVALPDAVDLRRPWHPVGDQGETASCVGWAIADSCLRWQLVEAGRLDPGQRLSARYVWMSAKETDQREEYPSTFLEQDGTSLKAGLDVVRKFGAVLEAELPWNGLASGPPEDYYRSAKSRRIMAYFNLHQDDRFDEWRRWMNENGPVLVLVAQDTNFHTCTGDLTVFDEASVNGSHAAVLYGYGPEHFLLRSTWGTDWGDVGYARLSLDYAAVAVIESYGVMI